jgi:hypothetical protein
MVLKQSNPSAALVSTDGGGGRCEGSATIMSKSMRPPETPQVVSAMSVTVLCPASGPMDLWVALPARAERGVTNYPRSPPPVAVVHPTRYDPGRVVSPRVTNPISDSTAPFQGVKSCHRGRSRKSSVTAVSGSSKRTAGRICFSIIQKSKREASIIFNRATVLNSTRAAERRGPVPRMFGRRSEGAGAASGADSGRIAERRHWTCVCSKHEG